MTNSVLCKRFADQVNVVWAQYGARAVTLTFTRVTVPNDCRDLQRRL